MSFVGCNVEGNFMLNHKGLKLHVFRQEKNSHGKNTFSNIVWKYIIKPIVMRYQRPALCKHDSFNLSVGYFFIFELKILTA